MKAVRISNFQTLNDEGRPAFTVAASAPNYNKHITPIRQGRKHSVISVNKYRGLCRRAVNECSHPEMTFARKLVIHKLADLIDDREGYTAYPAFTTLATYAGVSRDTAIRAVNIAKKIGLLIRVKGAGKKGLGGTTNRYGFRLKEVAGVLPLSDVKEVAGEPPKRSQACIERSSRPATQHTKDRLIDLAKEEEEKKVGLGERSERASKEDLPWKTPVLTEIEYTPELRKLYEESSEEVYTPGPVPRRYWRKPRMSTQSFSEKFKAGLVNSRWLRVIPRPRRYGPLNH